MSDEPFPTTAPKDTPGDELTTDAVVAFLRRQPDFFLDQEELLAGLRIPHKRGDTVSLVEHQLKLLRDRNSELRQRLTHLMDVARDNDRLFDKTRRLMLDLLDATSLEEVVMAVDDSLRQSFKVPFVSLILFTEAPSTVGRSMPLEEAQQVLGALLTEPRPVAGTLRPAQLQFLFGREHESVASCVVAPLAYQGVHGVLAIGSTDPEQYRSSVGTLFLAHVAEVLGRVLPRVTGTLRSVR
ncbi:DUF484 family protein [Pseudomonas sp. DC3000-4b1]|uniref:DUF484 family protein n=1 Tax=unclassified Pseudomonas TaxID=196821 RepID=UPI003CE718AF